MLRRGRPIKHLLGSAPCSRPLQEKQDGDATLDEGEKVDFGAEKEGSGSEGDMGEDETKEEAPVLPCVPWLETLGACHWESSVRCPCTTGVLNFLVVW